MLEITTGPVASALGRAALSLLRDLGVPTKIGNYNLLDIYADSGKTIDARLQKIDSARQNLAEALQAIDELADTAAQQKREMEDLSRIVEATAVQKGMVENELATLRSLARLDATSVRKVLEVPNFWQRWMERLIGFAFGVVASILASYIFGWLTPGP